MNKQYLSKLNERLVNGEKLTKTEKQIAWAYRDMLEYEYNWIGFRKTTDIDPEELSTHMLAADVDEIYITEEWSGQHMSWYKMQEAGFRMLSMRLIDNPRYQHEQMFRGKSDKDKEMVVMVFKLADRFDADDEYVPSAENGDYGPSNPWNAPGMRMSDFI